MSKRRKNNNSNGDFKKKRAAKGIVACICIALVATLGASIVGFASDGFKKKDVSTWFAKELNEDNLIKAEDYVIKDGQNDGKGVEATVEENGVIKLKGEATSDNSFIVATITLDAGTYTISGIKSCDDYGIEVTGADVSVRSGITNDTFTLEQASTVTVSIYVAEDTNLGLFGKTFEPTLIKGENAGDFYA